jgi:hypothetical protein
MVESMQAEHDDFQQSDANEGFKEQRRRKRSSSDDQGKQTKKAAMPTTGARDLRTPSHLELPTWNFFAPLRTAGMEPDSTEDSDRTDGNQQQQLPSSQTGRPPPIKLTSATNLIQLQKQLKGFVKGSFEFRSTRNGTRVVTKEIADFSAIKAYLNSTSTCIFVQTLVMCQGRQGWVSLTNQTTESRYAILAGIGWVSLGKKIPGHKWTEYVVWTGGIFWNKVWQCKLVPVKFCYVMVAWIMLG